MLLQEDAQLKVQGSQDTLFRIRVEICGPECPQSEGVT